VDEEEVVDVILVAEESEVAVVVVGVDTEAFTYAVSASKVLFTVTSRYAQAGTTVPVGMSNGYPATTGDEQLASQLVQLRGCASWHFPQAANNEYVTVEHVQGSVPFPGGR